MTLGQTLLAIAQRTTGTAAYGIVLAATFITFEILARPVRVWLNWREFNHLAAMMLRPSSPVELRFQRL